MLQPQIQQGYDSNCCFLYPHLIIFTQLVSDIVPPPKFFHVLLLTKVVSLYNIVSDSKGRT
jgi:hypothetical protein